MIDRDAMPTSRTAPGTTRSALRGLMLALLAVALPTVMLPIAFDAPLAAQETDPLVDYGSIRPDGAKSLNGFTEFAKLYEGRGCEVRRWNRLSPRIDKYSTIVWAPTVERPLTEEERTRLERWMAEGWNRTLVVILPEYRADRDYFERMLPQVDPTQQQTYRRRLSEAIADDLTRLGSDPEPIDDPWFDRGRRRGRRVVERITGDLADGLGDRVPQVVIDRDLRVPIEEDPEGRQYAVLLSADRRPFVVSIWDPDTEASIIVVANASFLCNYGMTNDGNRILAENLANWTCYEGEPVLFLESGDRPLPVTDTEESGQPMFSDWMKVWPLSFLTPHLLLIGVLIYFVYLPIFGRPRRLPKPAVSDFGRHVEAVGGLLERTGDRRRAAEKIRHYHDHVRSDSGGLGAAAGPRRRPPRESSP